MAGNDLGTARGSVKVTADTKGVGKAEKDLKLFDKALALVSRAGKQFENSLNKMERELNSASKDMREAAREANDLAGDISKADAETLKWSRDLGGLHERLKGVNQVAQDLGPSLLQIGRVGIEFRKTNGGIIGFSQALTRVGAASTVFAMLKSRFFGMGAAMAMVPAWGQSIIKFSNSFRLLTFGVGILTAVATKTGVFGKVYESVFRKIVKHSEMGGKALMGLEKRLKPFGPAFQKAVKWISETNKQVDKIPKGAVQALVGFGLMQNGIKSLAARFAFLTRIQTKWLALFGAAFSALPALVQTGAAALRGFSNLLMGLLDGVKQLAGGFLAIPAAVSMMITGIGTLKVLFAGLKKSFEDVFKAETPEELAAAIDALPEHLKPLGKVFGEIIPKWKEISTEMQKTFVIGAAEQLKALSEGILPAVKAGVLPLVATFRQVKDALVGFLGEAESVSFIKQSFMTTSQVVQNLSRALIPLLQGFRDIASVGQIFLRDLSAGATGVTEKFREWARVNKENGNLMKWMKDAVQGVKDLYNGLKDLGKALWTILTIFATDTGENFLERFAKSMEKFNAAVEKSAAEGVLKKIGDAVKTMGTDKIEQFWDVLRSLGDLLQELIPFIMSVSEAFGNVFYPALKLSMEIVEQFMRVLNAIGGGEALGAIIGMIAAFKTLSMVLGPLRNGIQVLFGAFNLAKGAQTVLSGLAGTLERFGETGKKAGGKIRGAATAIAGFSVAASAAMAGIGLLLIGATNGQQAFKAWDKAIADSAVHMSEWKKQLRDAFVSDKGLTGANVTTTVSAGVETMMGDLESASSAMPGFIDHVEDFWNGLTGTGDKHFNADAPGESEELNKLQVDAEKATGILNKLKELQGQGIDLGAVVRGSEGDFQKFIATLEQQGGASADAANKLKELRTEFVNMQADFAKAGPGAVQLAQGIEKIASAGGNAQTKLDGLKTALQGLGLLQTDAYDAAFALAEQIRGLGDAAANAVVDASQLGGVWDAQANALNTTNVNAASLYNTLKPLADSFLSAAAAGKNVNQSWTDMQPQLNNLREQFKLTEDQFGTLLRQLGMAPDAINILLQLEGKDTITRDVATVVTTLQQKAGELGKVEIPIVVEDPAATEAKLDAALGPVLDDFTTRTGNLLIIKPGIDPAAAETIKKVLSDLGVKVEGGPPPAPATVPVAPAPAGKPGEQPPAPAAPAPAAPAPAAPAPAPAAPPPPEPVKIPEPDIKAAEEAVNKIKTAIEDINNIVIHPKVESAELDNIWKKIEELWNKLKGIADAPALDIDIRVLGLDQIDQAKTKLDEFLAKSREAATGATTAWNNYKNAVTTAFNEVVTVFNSTMDQIAQKISTAGANNKTAGLHFGQDFAQGIRDSIDDISRAADDAARAAADRLPQNSPAKKGPLSGRGWSKYAGMHFAEDFAAGIDAASESTKEATERMGERATAGMGGRSESFQGFLSGIIRVLDLVSSAISVVQSTFDHISEGFKIITDLMKPPETRETETEHGRRAGQRPGPRNLPGAEGLAGVTDPSKEQIAAAIIGEAQKRGYGRDVAIGAIATGMLESGLDAVIENATGHKGIFQMDRAKPGRDTALGQITWFFDQLDSLDAKNAKDPLGLIASQIEKGGYGGEAISRFTGEASKFYDKLISQVGDNVDATSALRSDLTVTGRKGLRPAAENLLQVVADQFPEVKTIGGKREDALPYHPAGRALDIMIGKNMKLGDQINQYLRDNAEALGIESTIWRDTWKDMEGNASKVAGHMDHIHAQVLGDANAFNNALLTARGTFGDAQFNVDPEMGTQFADEVSSRDLSVYDAQAKVNDTLNTEELTKSDQDIIDTLREGNKDLDEAIKTGEDPTKTNEEQLEALNSIDKSINELGGDNAETNKQQIGALENLRGTVQSGQQQAGLPGAGAQAGIQGATDALGSVMQIAGGVMSITQDIIGLAKTTIETIGFVKQSMDLLVRGVENTEDLNTFIDTIQKFIELGAKVAQTVSDITGTIAGFVGAGASGDPSGGAAAAAAALQAVSAIAGLISAMLTTVNAAIDVVQEAWHIFGSYFGQFLGFLAGAGDQLEGDVKFLLDENDKTLKAYSRANPQDKAVHPYDTEVGGFLNAERGPVGSQIESITVFGGPNQDPRDTTRNMMFAVKSASMGSTYAQ